MPAPALARRRRRLWQPGAVGTVGDYRSASGPRGLPLPDVSVAPSRPAEWRGVRLPERGPAELRDRGTRDAVRGTAEFGHVQLPRHSAGLRPPRNRGHRRPYLLRLRLGLRSANPRTRLLGLRRRRPLPFDSDPGLRAVFLLHRPCHLPGQSHRLLLDGRRLCRQCRQRQGALLPRLGRGRGRGRVRGRGRRRSGKARAGTGRFFVGGGDGDAPRRGQQDGNQQGQGPAAHPTTLAHPGHRAPTARPAKRGHRSDRPRHSCADLPVRRRRLLRVARIGAMLDWIPAWGSAALISMATTVLRPLNAQRRARHGRQGKGTPDGFELEHREPSRVRGTPAGRLMRALGVGGAVASVSAAFWAGVLVGLNRDFLIEPALNPLAL